MLPKLFKNSEITVSEHYQPTIGIETHVQLKTKTKLFCGCPNDDSNAPPNTLVCEVCTGQPGSLPVLNEAAVEMAIRIGLAINASVAEFTKFDRKNYFYPDLPKGYQISQYDQPIVENGYIDATAEGKAFRVGIIRAHLEEDAGKLIHPDGADYSLADYNRAGTPLVEIVSAPDIHSPAQAKAYVQELYNLIRYADVSNADLYRGNMRFDVNVSVRKASDKSFGVRTETKNLNSFKSVERAAEYEIKRQIEELKKGKKIIQQTLGWDEAKGKTIIQRSKEEAHDYRYFPEPDLPPLVISKAMVDKAAAKMPDLPDKIRQRLHSAGLDDKTSSIILSNPDDAKLLLGIDNKEQLAGVAKYLTGKVRAYRNDHPDKTITVAAAPLIELFEMAKAGEVGSSAADEIIVSIIKTGKSPRAIAKSKNLLQTSDKTDIQKFVDAAIAENPEAVADFEKGNERSLQFLVGQVMKDSRGQANPQIVQEMLKKKLS